MGSLTVNNETLEKYFGFLKNLDSASKIRLIEKLNKSITRSSKKQSELQELFGAWDDSRSTEKIIKDLYSSRKEKQDSNLFP